jgi:hypothetical protein
MQVQLNSNTNPTSGKQRITAHRQAGQGRITYQDCCEFCEETKDLITIKQAGYDRHVCIRKHACFLLVEEVGQHG